MSHTQMIQRIEESYKEIEYNERIFEKYIDKKNHGNRVIVFSSGSEEIVPGGLYYIYILAEKGDFLVKKKGDSLAYLMKSDTVIVFNYLTSLKK